MIVPKSENRFLAYVNSDKYSFLRTVNVSAYFLSELCSFYLGRYLGTEYIGTVSDKYNVAIEPSTWAFYIWGAIYTGLLGFVIY